MLKGTALATGRSEPPKPPPLQSDLIFRDNFESGNLGTVEVISEWEFDISIRPDTSNDRHRVWFYFSVENAKPNQRIIINIINFSKTKSLYRNGASPVIKSEQRPQWHRIPSKSVFYYRSPRHKKSYIMSFAFTFDRADDVYYFAYSFPYTYTDLQMYLQELENRQLPYFDRGLLGYSEQGRRLDIITITSTSPAEEKRKIIFITSRVHPGESPASWVCAGIIDFLTSADPKAETLRRNLVFKIVPMLNPDGVFHGNYRCCGLGYDLNRYWQNPKIEQQPTIVATKNLLIEYKDDPAYELEFYIDIHAHSTLMNGFMYGNVYEDDERCQIQNEFPRLLDSKLQDFSLKNSSFNKDALKAGTGRRQVQTSVDYMRMPTAH
ncbi:cytosolic carboxypeptidase 6 [Polychytrium aggregatum]|uniref:cytosolic carboxypeptidase 6 n=1 Tax=Polychytrium aggregatum TaxID=110093 RepID=UPI0022FEF1B5|nr:cytosolic carboxypeptidase 6 [Polychytrium aggregatum]KAI9204182.1 cytosolic carboxypeptidase 6 [Polychytrium aggregatum]